MVLTHAESRFQNTTARNEFYSRMYLRYTNEFLTVDKFASYYGISIPRARQIIECGEMLSDKPTEL